MSILLITFCLLSAYIITDVNCLMCYDCNSLYDFDCEHLQKNDKLSYNYKYCTAPNASYVEKYQKPLCRKIEQKIRARNNLRIVKRYCGYERHQSIDDDVCYDVRNEDHEERVCQCFEDGCNSANVKSLNVYLNLAFSLSFVLWYYR